MPDQAIGLRDTGVGAVETLADGSPDALREAPPDGVEEVPELVDTPGVCSLWGDFVVALALVSAVALTSGAEVTVTSSSPVPRETRASVSRVRAAATETMTAGLPAGDPRNPFARRVVPLVECGPNAVAPSVRWGWGDASAEVLLDSEAATVALGLLTLGLLTLGLVEATVVEDAVWADGAADAGSVRRRFSISA